MKQPSITKNLKIIVSPRTNNLYFLNQKKSKNETEYNIRHYPEKALWRAVIMQSVLDIMNTSKRTEHCIAKQDAISWLNIKNQYFLKVCENSDLNPIWVLNKIKIALINPKTWRRACDLKKFIFHNINVTL